MIYNGKVVKTVEFGAFVNFIGTKDGLVHISELAPKRVGKVTDVVQEGQAVKVKVLGIDERGKVRLSMRVVDQVKVKVIGFDDRGKVKLSMRVVDQATGADISEQVGARRPREDGGDRPERGGERRDRGPRRGGEAAD